MQVVLKIFVANSLYANEAKCRFGLSQVDYLGHIISEQGVATDPVKIKSVLEWLEPTTIKGVRGFLRLASYYRKFIRNF